jgi:hypothetical protein
MRIENMTIKNFASTESTKLYSEKHKDLKYYPLGKTGLFVSEVGLVHTKLIYGRLFTGMR